MTIAQAGRIVPDEPVRDSFASEFDFVVIGAMKSGTTSIDKNLQQSSEIRLVSNFHDTRPPLFGADRDPRYAEFARNELAKIHVTAPKGTRVGHVKGDYHACPSAMDELLSDPELKLLLTYREPVSRVYSHYNHFIKHGYTRLDFDGWMRSKDGAEAIRLSSLGACLESFVDRITPARFAVMAMEDTSTNEGMAALADFLGIVTPKVTPGVHHATATPRNKTLNYAARQVIDRVLLRGSRWNSYANSVRKSLFLSNKEPVKLSPDVRAQWVAYFAEDYARFLKLSKPFLLPRSTGGRGF